VSFVYNNKLPFYIWGPYLGRFSFSNDDQGRPILHQISTNIGGIRVPLAEYGADPLFDANKSQPLPATLANRLAQAEASPCDAQMPWRDFVTPVRGQGDGLGYGFYGITMHGEIYRFPANGDSRWSVSAGTSARRMTKIGSDNMSSAFVSLSECQSTQISELPNSKVVNAGAVTNDGKAWLVGAQSPQLGRVFSLCEPVDLPEGELAKYISFRFAQLLPGSSVARSAAIVLTTQSNKTYLRNTISSKWFCLTTGCYETEPIVQQGTIQRWNQTNLPTFSVAPPPSGKTATVEPVWFETSGTTTFPIDMRITDPGSGYVTNPSVTASRPGDVNPTAPPPTIKLRVFNEYMDEAYHRPCGTLTFSSGGILCRSNANRLYRLRIPAHVTTESFVSTDDIPWLSESTPRDRSNVHVLVRDLAGNSNLVLGVDRKLYLLGADGSASGNRSLVDLFDGGEWQSIAFAGSVSCGIKTDGTMWSWGTQGNVRGALFGDLSEFGTVRTTPVQVASEAEWLRVRHFWDPLETGAMMLAIRKDAICRAIDQPFELWPDWAYGG
jgi:hypothetical protein